VTLALIITILIAAGLIVALVAEETARREWHREADSWRKRACHHGGSSWGPFDPNGDERERGRL
jgi:hypothetical protein